MDMSKDMDQTPTNIYKYTANMTMVLDDENYVIDNIHIKNIAIDYNYKEMNMPMIFATVVVDTEIIDKMVQNQDKAVIILDMKRAIANSDMPDLYTDYIVDKFIYFISEDINKMQKLNEEGDEIREDFNTESMHFKLTSIGLLSLDCVNNNKKSINGVINGKLSSIMYYLTGHLPVLIEPPSRNTMISNQFIPPTNSVSQSLEYLNSLHTFYHSAYRFFIDFDCTYLLSSSGNIVKRKGDKINSIILNLKNAYDVGSKTQGMSFDEVQGVYTIDIDGALCELADNHVSEKSYSKISAANTSGSLINNKLSNRTSESVVTEKSKTVRIVNDNEGLLENMVSKLNISAIQLLVQKVDIDASIFTMNKEYIVKADDVYGTDKYNGRYILSRKRELYIREDEDSIVNVMLLLEKIPS